MNQNKVPTYGAILSSTDYDIKNYRDSKQNQK